MRKYEQILGYPVAHILERIERYTEKIPFSDCHYWTGGLSRKNGYAAFHIREKGNRDNHKSFRVHRLIYELKIGSISGKHVLHSCDNPQCINPDHLHLGTHQDNMNEMVERKRNAFGSRAGSVRMTEHHVREIRNLYASGKYTTRGLGLLFNVDGKHIWNIVNGKKWKSVI
jgi:hypothetical protein